MPGPNFEPVKAILTGCPTPLKFVPWDLIRLFKIGSNVSFFKFFNCETLFWSSDMIFFALSSINFKSSPLNSTSSSIMYFELLYISSKVLALFLRNVRDFLIFSSFFELIFSLYFSQCVL